MTQARKYQICLEETPFYHCNVRCVRRAFLCGHDISTNQNFDHRRQWIVSRLQFLSHIFSIDICAYAVMSNHYHVVLHVDKTRALAWTDDEVIERWMQLYRCHPLVDFWLKNKDKCEKAIVEQAKIIVEKWRQRLFDIGWFMRGINETIARMANHEDNCKGRFWEGRYKSQALLDETALLSCMTYVDLNPVRANLANDVIDSDFTSIQQRLFDYINHKRKKNVEDKQLIQKMNLRIQGQQKIEIDLKLDRLPKATLMPFDSSSYTSINKAIPFTRLDYFKLVEDTGRIIRENKRGFIDGNIPLILQRLSINTDTWMEHIKQFGFSYGRAVGSKEKLKKFAKRLSDGFITRYWCRGISQSKRVYVS